MIGMVYLMEDYEAGYLDPRETPELYAELIRTGQARSLSEPCGRIAPLLIEAGYITPAGKIAPEGYAAAARHAEPTDGGPAPAYGGLLWGLQKPKSHFSQHLHAPQRDGVERASSS
jgi:hypothetical protein